MKKLFTKIMYRLFQKFYNKRNIYMAKEEVNGLVYIKDGLLYDALTIKRNE